jgi:uncharacterized phage-associated protein
VTISLRAIDIARWFAARAELANADVSNLKIQKLLYYAQGEHIARTGEPLFHDPLEAWAHGPVVPEVYHALKRYGPSPIDAETFVGDDFDRTRFDQVEPTLVHTWDTYGTITAWALRERTHRETPWKRAFATPSGRITIGHLEAFFRGRRR